jgi:hypothetical protein
MQQYFYLLLTKFHLIVGNSLLQRDDRIISLQHVSQKLIFSFIAVSGQHVRNCPAQARGTGIRLVAEIVRGSGPVFLRPVKQRSNRRQSA